MGSILHLCILCKITTFSQGDKNKNMMNITRSQIQNAITPVIVTLLHQLDFHCYFDTYGLKMYTRYTTVTRSIIRTKHQPGRRMLIIV